MQVPPLPQDFPNVDAACAAYGNAATFYYVDCGLNASHDIKDVEIQLYPNPNHGSFTIDFELTKEANVRLRLYDALGKMVENINRNSVTGRFVQAMEPNIPAGVYFMQIAIDNHLVTKKVVIR